VIQSPPYLLTRHSSLGGALTLIAVIVATHVVFQGSSPVQGAESVSETVGYNKIICPGGSDTSIGIPFIREPVFRGKIQGNPGVTNSLVLVTPAGSPVLPPSGFVSSPHYFRVLSGNLAGSRFDIRANTGQAITIDIGDEDASGLSANDTFDIVPHWTLSSLFPPATQEALHLSTGLLPSSRESRILLADVTSDGVQLAPDRVYFVTDQGWFQATAGFPAADDVVVEPGHVLIVRHKVGADDTIFYATSQVHQHAHRAQIRSRFDGPQDNPISLMRPVPVNLSELGLGSDVFVDSTSTDSADRGDELLVYDNITAALNKALGITYFRVAGEWRLDDGASYPVADDDLIPPSNALLLRKDATSTGETVIWINTPRY